MTLFGLNTLESRSSHTYVRYLWGTSTQDIVTGLGKLTFISTICHIVETAKFWNKKRHLFVPDRSNLRTVACGETRTTPTPSVWAVEICEPPPLHSAKCFVIFWYQSRPNEQDEMAAHK